MKTTRKRYRGRASSCSGRVTFQKGDSPKAAAGAITRGPCACCGSWALLQPGGCCSECAGPAARMNA